jgi:phage terminase large subunit
MVSKKRILCTREVQNTIRDSVHKLLSDRIEQLGLHDRYIIKADSIQGINGTEFIFKGLLRNTQDIKSTEGIDYCWVEEAQSVSRASLEVLIPTVRKEGSQIIFTYNPIKVTDPVHEDFKLAERDDCLKISINYNENPFFPEVLRRDMEYDKVNDFENYLHVWEGYTRTHSDAQVMKGKFRVDKFDAPVDDKGNR